MLTYRIYLTRLTFVILILLFIPDLSAQNIDSLENELKSAEDSNRISLLNQLSVSYRSSSPVKSLDYSKKALKLSEAANDYESQSRSLRNIGIAYSYKSQYDSAKKYFELSLKIAKEFKLTNQIVLSYNSLGNYNYLTGNLDKALEYYLDAYSTGKELGNKTGLTSYLSNIGIIYHNKGNYEKALEYYVESLKISEELNDKPGISRALTNIGAVYNDIKNYEKALESYNRALEVTKETNDLHTRANILNNIGNIYSSQNKLENALDVILKSLRIKEEIGDEFGIAVSLGDIGRIYSVMGENGLAIEYLIRSFNKQKELGNIEGEIMSLINLGRTYRDMNNFSKALNAFDQAAELSKNFSAKLLLDAFFGKSITYEKIGNYKDAYQSYKQYSQLKDSLFNETSSSQIAELQTKYESEKKDKEISLLQREKEIKELELSRQAILRNSLIAGLIVLIIIALLIHNRYRIKNKANKELEDKITKINEQKEELKEVNANKDKLLSIISHDLRSPFQTLLGYSDLLASNITEINKEEIITYAEDLNLTSQRTLELLENLLEWARLQLGKINCNPQKFLLAPVVENTTALLKQTAANKNIDVKTNIPDNILVYADEQMVSSIIQNFLSNAIKFSNKNDTIKIEAVNINEHVKVSVRDYGVGINKEDIEKLFNKNLHHSTNGTLNEKGTGLGLEICKEMIEMNNGEIKVESEVGKGSKFIFTLPKAE